MSPTLSKPFGQIIMAALLALGLSGCVDAKVDVAITGDSTARTVMTQTMGADFYTMVKTSAEQAAKSDTPPGDGFCADGELTENSNGSATCVLTEEGKFADLSMGGSEESVVFAAAGPGLVRVSLSLAAMKAEMGAGDMDEETRQMIEAFFAGRTITLRFSGAEVTETNMTLSDDKSSAQKVIPFLDLIRGKPDLPEALYAVVRAP